MAEDHFAPSHHIPPRLSTPEPPVEILSLNYCTQHIPVNRTHAYMRARTAKHLSPQTSPNELLHMSQRLLLISVLAHSVICSHNSFVR